ncbi:Hypothetical protein CINCED_3A010007 [Cinara cedri]|uniref:Uncharacterized protein n=1 Tax=Cinara cedri TaxID=506608 RepID=A0A5E4N9V2_9HEMI|nr:Hypothetical protein CINCED_3A010007 [Cinara cedri]
MRADTADGRATVVGGKQGRCRTARIKLYFNAVRLCWRRFGVAGGRRKTGTENGVQQPRDENDAWADERNGARRRDGGRERKGLRRGLDVAAAETGENRPRDGLGASSGGRDLGAVMKINAGEKRRRGRPKTRRLDRIMNDERTAVVFRRWENGLKAGV